MKKALLIAVVLAAVIGATQVWSQGRPQGPREGRPHRGPGMACPAMAVMSPPPGVFEREAEALGITDDQLTKLTEAMKTSEETVRPLVQAADEACKALREAIMAAEYDAQSVATLATAAEKAEAAVVTARIDTWTQIRSILTADQITALQEMMRAHRPGPGGPPPMGSPPPPPGR